MLVSRSLRWGELEDGRAFMVGSVLVMDVVSKEADALVLMYVVLIARVGVQVEESTVWV